MHEIVDDSTEIVLLHCDIALWQKTENQMTVKIKVIIFKLCGKLFLWNNIWDLEIEMVSAHTVIFKCFNIKE